MNKLPSILDLDGVQAREYLLRGASYCTVKLPPYFEFDTLLNRVAGAVGNYSQSDLYERKKIRDLEDVNYSLVSNKDGKYAWRRFDLIHPIVYVLLVNCITESDSWEHIRHRFTEFWCDNDRIRCLSLPVKPQETEKADALQVTQWWHEIELQSIEFALDYEYMIHTDVVDCYPSIYTHSIPWALHGKEESKNNRRDSKLIGNVIDKLIQDMRRGQTNGIPQGSVLMDLIAEMVLGYADSMLVHKLGEDELEEYKILRYRDDYRIFTSNPLDGEKILGSLADVMMDLGMKLHPQKTEASDQLIWSSIKRDKRSWICRKQRNKDLRNHLLIIHDHSTVHPNSGSLVVALTEFRDLLDEVEKYDWGLPLISIAVDIAYRNPRTYPQVSSIVSKCLEYLGTEEDKKDVLQRIENKFSRVANAGLMDLWLQRIYVHADQVTFEEPLCTLVLGEGNGIWNSSWVKMRKVRKTVIAESIIDRKCIDELPPVIDRKEVELFPLPCY